MIDLKLVGPFAQILTMSDLNSKGPISDTQLSIVRDGGILIQGSEILEVGDYQSLKDKVDTHAVELVIIEGDQVALPGIVDAHTHICFGGNRARDYALRNSGSSYLEIAAAGGGIWDTVTQTRAASVESLTEGIVSRAWNLIQKGTTTIEVKSGYGLSVLEEIKMLTAIKNAEQKLPIDLIPTCLAAHIIPKEYKSNPTDYVTEIVNNLFPRLQSEGLSNRVDAFVEQEAYTPKLIAPYFEAASKMGFDITIHADQFHPAGSQLAVKYGAISADHLEVSTDKEIEILSKSEVIPMALPGATLGLGCSFTPARKLLDAGCSLAIASDYNPGSAPMGDLITQASILGVFQKLTNAEVLAGITIRAAAALNKTNIGTLEKGKQADLAIFKTDNYQNILYRQGQLQPNIVFAKGKIVVKK